ncbi:MAG TPA: DUF362 domain-containing protein [Kiritimatiellia bacterium]|nr:DUF362 domain-containing protein [Kiritimatiellia bacterium]
MSKIAIGTTMARYCNAPPYHPDTRYPESPMAATSGTPNPAYQLFRKLLIDLEYDAHNAGRPEWNPLGHVIRPGNTVVIKPNFVLHENGSGGDLFAVITHPSILRAIADYVYLALKGRGRIIIADAPQMDCSWDRLSARLQLDDVQRCYREYLNFNLEVMDLRTFELIDAGQPAYAGNRRARPGDPSGSVTFDLGTQSAFHGIPSENFYGADYNRRETIARHHDDVHQYEISKTILSADVIISVPKMKVHKKVGVTLNLKGLVGINTNKNCLIHYRLGTPSSGGDQLPDGADKTDTAMIRSQRKLFDILLSRQTWWSDILYKTCRGMYRALIKPFRPISTESRLLDAGNWYGNDSAWRMTSDLAAILFYGDRHGNLHKTMQRKIFCIVDGIIAGENEGPLAPDAKPAGILVAGENPLAVDIATARLMGFDPLKIKSFAIRNSNVWNFGVQDFQGLDILLDGNHVPSPEFFSPEWKCPVPPFVPHPGWIGHIELNTQP